MAGVAMESRLFRIHPSARDTPFIDACAAFLTPKMDLSKVMPSGCNLHRVAHPPGNQLAVPDRPSASDYQEEEETIDPTDMHMAIAAPVFQPYRGATGRAWMAKEYRLSVDTSSLLSSGTERDDTDEEVFSFDLGPELQPRSSEPKHDQYVKFNVMPKKPSILDMMRNDMDDDETAPPQSPEHALTPTIGWDYEYTMDEPWMRRRDTLHHIQNLLCSVHAIGRLCNYRAHGLRWYLPLRNQRSAWLYVTIR